MKAAVRWTWCAALLGFAGSVLTAYAAPRALDDRVVGWWYQPTTPSGRGVSEALVYAGMAALAVAWLALGRALPGRGSLLLIAVAWALPLALAPPLFSRDAYSYLAQGTILHLGHNPYHSAPGLLAALGHEHVLAAVSPFWRATTAPYGPLFLEIVSAIVGAVGSSLVAGVLLVRLVELAGMLLLAMSVPRLARALGSDERRALWLALLSPLAMLQLVAAAHNDVLMIGLLAAGVACALSGRPLTGIAICALAATIKLPALAGAIFIAVAWGRAEAAGRPRLRFGAATAVVAGGIIAAVTLAAGVGVDWISTSLFSTPAKVRLAITPATALGYTVHLVAHALGTAGNGHSLEHAFVTAALVPTAIGAALLLYRAHIARLVAALGACLVLAAAGGPAAWPWYFTWGLVLLAAVPGVQRSWAVAVAVAVAALVVKPSGQLAIPLPASPYVLAGYAAIVAAVLWRHRRRAAHAGGGDEPPGAGGSPGEPAIGDTRRSALAGA